MPFALAVARAGSLEALLVASREGRVFARCAEFFVNGVPTKSADRGIHPDWWAENTAHNIDPAAGLARFWLHNGLIEYETVAIGIEFAAVEAVWPATTVPALAPAPQHAGGRDPEHNWEGAAGHVDAWIKKHGRPLPRHKGGKQNGKPIVARAVELMTEWFEDNERPAPLDRSIRRWIGKNPRSWWGPN
jgi:hypothetical protein